MSFNFFENLTLIITNRTSENYESNISLFIIVYSVQINNVWITLP